MYTLYTYITYSFYYGPIFCLKLFCFIAFICLSIRKDIITIKCSDFSSTSVIHIFFFMCHSIHHNSILTVLWFTVLQILLKVLFRLFNNMRGYNSFAQKHKIRWKTIKIKRVCAHRFKVSTAIIDNVYLLGISEKRTKIKFRP